MRRALALAVVVVVAGCGSAAPRGAGGEDRATVFAASSLTEVFPKIDAGARFSFGGSDALATQIREGAPADVFAAASPKYPDELYAGGLLEKPAVFATNRLVLVVPRANPAHVESVADLRRPGVKLVVGAEGVPVGDYTRTVLANLHESDVLAQVVSEEDEVKGVVGKVALGEADAGFVYATDVAPVADKVRAIELPETAQAEVRYEIAVVKDGADQGAAHRFVERVLGPEGRRALKAAGFGLP